MKHIEHYKVFKLLNESLLSDEQRLINKSFLDMADPDTGLCVWDDVVIKPADVVKIVDKALSDMREEWPYWYSHFMDYSIIWATLGMKVDTMAVDEHLNLYINPVFVQYYLKNKVEYAEFVLMHEMMHCVFDHVARSKNYIENSPNPVTWKDTNLAGDLEINTFLVLLHVITKEEIQNEIGGGVILDDVNSVIALETILDNNNIMKKLRDKFDKSNKDLPQPDQSNNPTNNQDSVDPKWLEGFNEAKRIINELVDKGLSTEEIKQEIKKIRK